MKKKSKIRYLPKHTISLYFIIVLIVLFFFSSCKSNSSEKLDKTKVNYQILDSYRSGNLKRIQYSFGDTILEHSLLQTGFIYSKKTFIKSELIDEIKSNQYKWSFSNLYKVDFVVEQYIGDTLNIWINDESYVWFDDYVQWKSDFFIYENYKNLEATKLVKIRFIQDGKDEEQGFIYENEDINYILNFYSKNDKFKTISSLFLRDFDPTDIFNLRNAHIFIKEEKNDYEFDYVSLLYDFSLCKTDCFAEKRLRFIGEMLYDIKLNDFWTDNSIEPDSFIKKLNDIFEIMEKEKIKI